MKMRNVVAVAATLAVVLGAWIALGGFAPVEALLGRSVSGAASGGEVERGGYGVLALARTAGAALAALGAVVLAVAWSGDRKVHGWAAVLGGGFATVIVLLQQVAIWDTTLGWLLVATLGLVTLTSSLMLRGDGGEEGAPRPA